MSNDHMELILFRLDGIDKRLEEDVLPRLDRLNGWRNKVLGAAAVLGGSVTIGAVVGVVLRLFGIDLLGG